MTKHHLPFQALAPVDWSSILREPSHDENDSMGPFVAKTFRDAQTVIDSIPVRASSERSSAAHRASRLRSHTDSSVTPLAGSVPPAATAVSSDPQVAAKIRPEWKEVKLNPRENPLGISVYKLAAKDGRGSWFARRSLHDGLPFERWRLALEREFAESLKVTGKPGGGNIRGIGAERRVELELYDGLGRVEVYQLSAQFPGPTTPRDFVTLLLSSGNAQASGRDAARQFMVVSKPCNHFRCPARPGFIRGQYESVELIREVPLPQPSSSMRARSSIDLRDDASSRLGPSESPGLEAEQRGAAVEWLMVTRSDPGGSVPRFMVEKGTPSGIVSDAARFLKWATLKDPESFATTEDEGSKSRSEAIESGNKEGSSTGPASTSAIKQEVLAGDGGQPRRVDPGSCALRQESRSFRGAPELDQERIENPGGFYSMIASAVEAASVAVASRLPNPFLGAAPAAADIDTGTDSEEDSDTRAETPSVTDGDGDDNDSDKSSIRTFESAVEPTYQAGEERAVAAEAAGGPSPPTSLLSKESRASSSLSTATTATQIAAGGSSSRYRSHHEKEMRKLQARRQKLDEKLARIQAKSAERDVASREKAENEASRLQAKYRREVQKLEQKRLAEERKARERVAKQQGKEDKQRMNLELDKAKTERDLARREVEMLRSQVGELQSQNTRLVAQLGRLGVDFKDDV